MNLGRARAFERGTCGGSRRVLTVALERLLVLQHVALVDEPLPLRGDVSLVARAQRGLEIAHGRAQLDVQGDLRPRRRLDVDRRRRHGPAELRTTKTRRARGGRARRTARRPSSGGRKRDRSVGVRVQVRATRRPELDTSQRAANFHFSRLMNK